jgi:hypothetical protein
MRIMLALPVLVGLSFTRCLAQSSLLIEDPLVAGVPMGASAGAPEFDGGVSRISQLRKESQAPALRLDDWILISAAAPLRYFDYRSTEKALSEPSRFHEAELPAALVRNQAGFAAFEAGTVVATYFVYRVLVRRRHRTLARWGQAVNLGALSWSVEHNYQLLGGAQGQP